MFIVGKYINEINVKANYVTKNLIYNKIIYSTTIKYRYLVFSIYMTVTEKHVSINQFTTVIWF